MLLQDRLQRTFERGQPEQSGEGKGGRGNAGATSDGEGGEEGGGRSKEGLLGEEVYLALRDMALGEEEASAGGNDSGGTNPAAFSGIFAGGFELGGGNSAAKPARPRGGSGTVFTFAESESSFVLDQVLYSLSTLLYTHTPSCWTRYYTLTLLYSILILLRAGPGTILSLYSTLYSYSFVLDQVLYSLSSLLYTHTPSCWTRYYTLSLLYSILILLRAGPGPAAAEPAGLLRCSIAAAVAAVNGAGDAAACLLRPAAAAER
jgi:hypothetical protein